MKLIAVGKDLRRESYAGFFEGSGGGAPIFGISWLHTSMFLLQRLEFTWDFDLNFTSTVQ